MHIVLFIVMLVIEMFPASSVVVETMVRK